MVRRASKLEAEFESLWKIARGEDPSPQREYQFDPGRAWRFDFAWPSARVAVELEGGLFRGGKGGGTALGGHNSAGGFQSDLEKYNAANDLGWRVYRYTAKDLKDRPLQVVDQIAAAVVGGDS